MTGGRPVIARAAGARRRAGLVTRLPLPPGTARRSQTWTDAGGPGGLSKGQAQSGRRPGPGNRRVTTESVGRPGLAVTVTV